GARVAGPWADGPERVVLGRGVAVDAALRALRADPDVLYAEPDRPVHAATIPNDPSLGQQWNLDDLQDTDIDAPQAWDVTTGRSATTVAVTDTGINFAHPDLYLSIAIDQGEIPAAIRSRLVDTDGDGLISFYDLNSLDPRRVVVRDGSGQPVNSWATRD